MQRILTPWRLKWYPRVLLFAIAAAFLIAILSGRGALTLTGRLGGDYPEFYSAGRIIAEGDWKNLYNPERLAAAQKDLLPGEGDGYLYFMYPPFVAVAYYPLALLNYKLSYILHTFLMLGGLILIIHFIRPMNELVDKYNACALFLALSFYPIFKSIFGGQNSMITLLLIVISWRAVLARHESLAGVVLGLLLFKPQFGLPLIGLYVLSGRWRLGIWSGLTALVLYGVGALIAGPFWISAWLRRLEWFRQTHVVVNYPESVSWLGVSEAIWGATSHFGTMIGWGMILLTAVSLILLWGLWGRDRNLTVKLALTMPGLILMAPHAMYYDLGLVLFTYSSIVMVNSLKMTLLIGLVWLFGLGQFLSVFLGFSPLFFLLIFTAVLAISSLGRFVSGKPCAPLSPIIRSKQMNPPEISK